MAGLAQCREYWWRGTDGSLEKYRIKSHRQFSGERVLRDAMAAWRGRASILAECPFCAFAAIASEAVDLVLAGATVLAWTRRAFVNVLAACGALPSRRTSAHKLVGAICARPAVLAGVGGAFIDVDTAGRPLEAACAIA